VLPKDKDTLSFTDLTVKEIWEIIRYFFTAVFICTIMFVIPFFIVMGVEFGAESFLDSGQKKWIEYIVWFLIIIFLIGHLDELFMGLSDCFRSLGESAKDISFLKKMGLFVFVAFYFFLWLEYVIVAFFFSVLILVPSGFAYDKYRNILRKKMPGE